MALLYTAERYVRATGDGGPFILESVDFTFELHIEKFISKLIVWQTALLSQTQLNWELRKYYSTELIQ